jgi:integration host factor subunit alpha
MPYKTTFEKMNQKNLTRKELALSVTNKLGISQRNAAEIVDTVFATLKNTLVGGESIKLVQFGSFVVRDKSPRRGRNPKTGESMLITKRQMVNFRPSRQLRERLNG